MGFESQCAWLNAEASSLLMSGRFAMTHFCVKASSSRQKWSGGCSFRRQRSWPRFHRQVLRAFPRRAERPDLLRRSTAAYVARREWIDTSRCPARHQTSQSMTRVAGTVPTRPDPEARPDHIQRPSRRLVSLAAAATILGISTGTARRLDGSRRLQAVRLISRHLVDLRDLDILITSHKERV